MTQMDVGSNLNDLSGLPKLLDARLERLIMAEYEDLVASMRSNEELGERRLHVFLTLIAAVTAAIGLASSRFVDDISPLVAITAVAGALILIVGLMTLRRIMVRNLVTSKYMNGLRRIRALFVQLQPEAVMILSFPPERKPVLRVKTGRRYGIGKGGLLETVAAINSFLVAVVIAGSMWLLDAPVSMSLGVGSLTALVGWIAQMEWTMATYKRDVERDTLEREKNLAALQKWTESR